MGADIKTFLTEEVERFGLVGHPALMQRFVLRNGKVYKGVARPKWIKRGQQRECFKNAFDLAQFAPGDFTYCEGYGVSANVDFMLIHHAWVVTKDGHAIDPTWSKPAHSLYMGVEFDLDTHIELIRRYDLYNVLGGDMVHGDLLFERDPGLKDVLAEVKENAKQWRALTVKLAAQQGDQ